jgi:regulator of cell morphogenesis and NO signaling
MLNHPIDAPLPPTADEADLSASELIARIVERHHGYLRSALPVVRPLVDKIAAVHGAKDPALVELARVFEALCARLGPHLHDEEARLFPALLAGRHGDPAVAAMLEALRAEHAELRGALRQVRELAHGYVAPDWACRTYRRALAELEDLEADLQRHLHLEQVVLLARLAA